MTHANFLLGVPLACIVIPGIVLALTVARGLCALCDAVCDLWEYVGCLYD